MMTRPMPSPRGTNHERLFLRDQLGALDAALEGGPEGSEGVKRILAAMAEALSRLSHEEFLELKEGLDQLLVPPTFDKLPRHHAMDAAGRSSFNARFPEAARIKSTW